MIKDKLWWERFRPKKIENMILLPRIKAFVKDGIKTNLLFFGHSGTGKSCISKILTENTNCLKINCKKNGGIDVVREEVENHCSKYGLFSKRDENNKILMKTVLLEEFDGASPEFQGALNDFIEQYKDVVRFIATVNNKNKIIDPLLSRFNKIDFEPNSKEETDFLKSNQLKYLKSIVKAVKFEVAEEVLTKIINKNFPDFRATIQDLQEIYIIGNADYITTGINSNYEELYNFILDGKNDVKENYFFVMDSFKDKTDTLLKYLGRPFFKYLMENNDNIVKTKGELIIDKCKYYCATYTQTIDPEMHLISYITELKGILKK